MMSQQRTEFPLGRITEIKGRPEDFQLLERVPLTLRDINWPVRLSEPVGDEKKIVLLDVETTGVNLKDDEITELGMVSILYSPSATKVTSIKNVISLYDNPGKPIPENITELTGITDEMVKGQKIDEKLVVNWLKDTEFIVAHYAHFDRNMFEKRFPDLGSYRWACSLKGIDWKSLGFKNLSLDVLLMRLGYFFQAHRASVDCLAMAWLFHLLPQAFESLLESAIKRTVRVSAMGAPYDVKDVLKERKYYWHNGDTGLKKHWWCEIAEEHLEVEKQFLDELYYQGAKKAQYDFLDATSRFKEN
jgi:DNA polymerase III subunit epsilon